MSSSTLVSQSISNHNSHQWYNENMDSMTMNLSQYDLAAEDEESRCRRAKDDQHIFDCISAMLRQEEHYLCYDYLDSQAVGVAITKKDAIDESCRSKMTEWIFHVIDSTRLQRETASVAMHYLDQYLCSSSERATRARFDRKEYQLAAMTCFYVAVKIYEPFEMDAPLMSRLSRGLHSAEEITTMEYDILIALQWKISCPTPVQFVNHILELLPESITQSAASALYDHSRFQTELAVGDYAFVPHIRPSTVAVASILNSLGGVEQNSPVFDECVRFIQEISNAFELDIASPLVGAVRNRLLESFAKSSGYELQTFAVPKQAANAKVNAFEISPACVSKMPIGHYMT